MGKETQRNWFKKKKLPDRKTIRTRTGGLRVVYPVATVTLGQPMAVVVGQAPYIMAGLWDRMSNQELIMAGKAGTWVGNRSRTTQQLWQE